MASPRISTEMESKLAHQKADFTAHCEEKLTKAETTILEVSNIISMLSTQRTTIRHDFDNDKLTLAALRNEILFLRKKTKELLEKSEQDFKSDNFVEDYFQDLSEHVQKIRLAREQLGILGNSLLQLQKPSDKKRSSSPETTSTTPDVGEDAGDHKGTPEETTTNRATPPASPSRQANKSDKKAEPVKPKLISQTLEDTLLTAFRHDDKQRVKQLALIAFRKDLYSKLQEGVLTQKEYDKYFVRGFINSTLIDASETELQTAFAGRDDEKPFPNLNFKNGGKIKTRKLQMLHDIGNVYRVASSLEYASGVAQEIKECSRQTSQLTSTIQSLDFTRVTTVDGIIDFVTEADTVETKNLKQRQLDITDPIRTTEETLIADWKRLHSSVAPNEKKLIDFIDKLHHNILAKIDEIKQIIGTSDQSKKSVLELRNQEYKELCTSYETLLENMNYGATNPIGPLTNTLNRAHRNIPLESDAALQELNRHIEDIETEIKELDQKNQQQLEKSNSRLKNYDLALLLIATPNDVRIEKNNSPEFFEKIKKLRLIFIELGNKDTFEKFITVAFEQTKAQGAGWGTVRDELTKVMKQSLWTEYQNELNSIQKTIEDARQAELNLRSEASKKRAELEKAHKQLVAKRDLHLTNKNERANEIQKMLEASKARHEKLKQQVMDCRAALNELNLLQGNLSWALQTRENEDPIRLGWAPKVETTPKPQQQNSLLSQALDEKKRSGDQKSVSILNNENRDVGSLIQNILRDDALGSIKEAYASKKATMVDEAIQKLLAETTHKLTQPEQEQGAHGRYQILINKLQVLVACEKLRKQKLFNLVIPSSIISDASFQTRTMYFSEQLQATKIIQWANEVPLQLYIQSALDRKNPSVSDKTRRSLERITPYLNEYKKISGNILLDMTEFKLPNKEATDEELFDWASNETHKLSEKIVELKKEKFDACFAAESKAGTPGNYAVCKMANFIADKIASISHLDANNLNNYIKLFQQITSVKQLDGNLATALEAFNHDYLEQLKQICPNEEAFEQIKEALVVFYNLETIYKDSTYRNTLLSDYLYKLDYDPSEALNNLVEWSTCIATEIDAKNAEQSKLKTQPRQEVADRPASSPVVVSKRISPTGSPVSSPKESLDSKRNARVENDDRHERKVRSVASPLPQKVEKKSLSLSAWLKNLFTWNSEPKAIEKPKTNFFGEEEERVIVRSNASDTSSTGSITRRIPSRTRSLSCTSTPGTPPSPNSGVSSGDELDISAATAHSPKDKTNGIEDKVVSDKEIYDSIDLIVGLSRKFDFTSSVAVIDPIAQTVNAQKKSNKQNLIIVLRKVDDSHISPASNSPQDRFLSSLAKLKHNLNDPKLRNEVIDTATELSTEYSQQSYLCCRG